MKICINNGTLKDLFEKCKEEFTRDSLIDALLEEYDADRALIEKDVDNFIANLRTNQLIDEA